MVTYLEQFIAEGFANIFGYDLWLGLFFVGFFMAYLLMSRSSFESKMVIAIPVFILASAFINWFLVITLLIVGFIVTSGVQKLMQQ
jgi:hypothetical protein